jgi:PAS domain S-box-containing protein
MDAREVAVSTDDGDVQMPPMAGAESAVRLVVDAIPTQVWRAAANGTVQFVNQPWIDYTGLSLEQSWGGVWSESNVAHGDDLPGFLDTWQRALATGKPAEVEARLRRFDGAYRWFLIRAAPLRDHLGEIVQWYGTNTDIHDRKEAEAWLAGENRVLEMLAQGHPLASILSRLCDMVEGLFSDSFVSIMLLNPDDNRLWYSAKGSLPPAYTQALDGIEVGPSQGSCGTAAFLNEPVIVPDVTTDPRWLQYRDITAAFGIRACWSTPIRSSEGSVLGTFAILVREAGTPSPQHRQVIAEVTHLASVAIARTRIEMALRRSEAYLAEAQRLSRTGSFGWNVASGELFWSKETFSILGYAPGTKPTLELVFRRVHPDDLLFVQETVARASRNGGDLDFEHRLLSSDGSVQHLHVRAQAVRKESGALEFIGAVSDVTAAKEADERIRRNEGELRQIIDTIPQLIAVLSPSGEVLYANESVLEFTGLRAEDVKGDGFRSWLFHPDDLERLRDERRRRLEQGAPFELEARARGKDPIHRWFLIHYEPLLDGQGRIVRWYATGTDIDDRKRAEDRIRNENQALREEINRTSMFEEIVGASEALRAVLQQVAQVAPTDSTVLITGETGTGKELVARAIHRRSARSARAFVSVNCAAVPASLVVSELFGHERGAFTGALQQRQGRFELADGGTIFLDEVGELPADAQVALLRVLQERQFERLGGSRPIRIDVRVIAATNRDLQTALAEKAFRADLFYRLNVFPVEVPPLRRRGADIPLLVEYFVHRFAKRAGKNIRGISEGTFDLLRQYPWPGNIRELQNVIERAVIVCDSEILSVDERWLVKQPKLTVGAMPPLDDELAAHEKARVEAALAESKGRVSGPLGAAARLGIPRSTLESKIRSLKVDKHRFKTNES